MLTSKKDKFNLTTIYLFSQMAVRHTKLIVIPQKSMLTARQAGELTKRALTVSFNNNTVNLYDQRRNTSTFYKFRPGTEKYETSKKNNIPHMDLACDSLKEDPKKAHLRSLATSKSHPNDPNVSQVININDFFKVDLSSGEQYVAVQKTEYVDGETLNRDADPIRKATPEEEKRWKDGMHNGPTEYTTYYVDSDLSKRFISYNDLESKQETPNPEKKEKSTDLETLKNTLNEIKKDA